MGALHWPAQAREAIARARRRRLAHPVQALIPANNLLQVVDRELASYRIRLIGQLVRPAYRHLRQWEDSSATPGGMLSLLLLVSHCFSTSDGPATARGVDLARRGRWVYRARTQCRSVNWSSAPGSDHGMIAGRAVSVAIFDLCHGVQLA
jgi:hypothetical protein